MKRTWRWPLAGFVVGGLIGATFLTVNVVGASGPEQRRAVNHSFGEILHTPPLILKQNEPVELTFGVVCGLSEDRPEARCSPKGLVYLRASGTGEFRALRLAREPNGQLSAEVPSRYTGGAGFDYYAEIEDGRGYSATLPPGAAAAPQHAWIASNWTTVALGSPRFGEARRPDSIVVRASWGKGDRALGLDSGREQSRIGPSAFDLAPDGAVVVLDQVNDRLAVYRHDARPRHLPIAFSGGEGDLAIAGDGTAYVLDAGGAGSSTPIVRSFDSAGQLIAGIPLAEPTADMVRAGPGGPLVHAYPSEMWLPTGRGRPPVVPSRQIALARPGRAVAGYLEVVVRASPGEARFALVRGDRVVQAWIVKAPTSLGEVQLAEPYGNGLLAVVRLWTEKRAEFRVLQLQPAGLTGSFAVDRAEWAETASLSRFRLHGSTLYQLRSAPSGVEIALFEIGGTT